MPNRVSFMSEQASGKSDTAKPRYGPVPFRAFGDQRLTCADFRVLGAIAAHHGLGVNGRGCDAGRARLAYLCGINLATFSASVGVLEALGYVSVESHPADGRRRVWRVIYTAQDGILISTRSNPTNEDWVASRPPVSDQLGGQVDTDQIEIGCPESAQSPDFSQDVNSNIFSERENKFPERGNKSAGSASFEETLRRLKSNYERSRSVQSQACEIDRKWREGELDSVDAILRLTKLYEQAEVPTETKHIERIVHEIKMSEQNGF